MSRIFSLAARWVLVIAVLGATMFGLVPFAEAHTDFESSSPADGQVVDQAVSEIRIRFSAASIVAGDGFVVFTPAGELVQPEIRVSEDEREFTLLLDPALTDGVVGVQWSVRAGDAHPIEGSFSFTSTASAPLADPVPSQTDQVDATSAPPLDQAPAEETAALPEGIAVAGADSAAGAAISDAPEAAPLAGTSTSNTSAETDVAEASEQAARTESASLEDFLNTEAGIGAAGPIGYLGRLASQAGSLVAIGVVGFALLVSTQEPNETRMFVFLIRQAATLTLIGAIARAVGLVVEVGSFNEALISSTGLAVGLRAVGATALLVGSASTRLVAAQPPRQASARVLAKVGARPFSGAIDVPDSEPTSSVAGVQPTQSSGRIGAGEIGWAAVIALSFVFDGHTVSKGNHLLTGLVAVIHVVGGAVWLGGLICLVLLARQSDSHRDGSHFMATVVRFSVVAAVALVAVGAAGLALTITILDSVSELWSTAWGRILIAKVLIVAVAAVAGAFNHFVLVPEMQSVSSHVGARRSFVRTMVVELSAIGAAVVLTAFLVAAAS